MAPPHTLCASPPAAELTGITQDMVDSGVSLQQALQGCEQWLAGLGVDPTRPFPVLSPGTTLPSAAEAAPASVPCTGLIVTCGDWDMRHLAKEAKSKGLHPAPIFSTWINIKVRHRSPGVALLIAMPAAVLSTHQRPPHPPVPGSLL